MSSEQDVVLSEQHFALFGSIIQCFAQHEALMDELVASLIASNATSVKLLMARHDFAEKRDALLNLMRHRNVAVAHFDRVTHFLAVPQTHAALRNDIAHSVWAKSTSQNAIYPRWLSHGSTQAVRPVHDVDRLGQKFQERPEDQASYTVEDLSGVVAILTRNCAEFRRFLGEVGLIPPA